MSSPLSSGIMKYVIVGAVAWGIVLYAAPTSIQTLGGMVAPNVGCYVIGAGAAGVSYYMDSSSAKSGPSS